MGDANVPELLQAWGLGSEWRLEDSPDTPPAGYRVIAPSGRFVLKPYKTDRDRLDIALEGWLLSLLVVQQLPVAPPLPTTAGAYYASTHDASGEEVRYCLYPQLAGDALADYYGPGAQRRAYTLGRAIALLHLGLSRLPHLPEFPEMNLASEVFGPVKQALLRDADAQARSWFSKLYAALEEEFLPRYGELPQQVIHRDIHPGNVLFQDERVAGFIDFELATWSVRAFDLAYCAGNMLTAAADDPVRHRQWLDLLTALLAGYDGLMALRQVERELLWHLQLSNELIFLVALDEEESAAHAELLEWLYAHKREVRSASVDAVGTR